MLPTPAWAFRPCQQGLVLIRIFIHIVGIVGTCLCILFPSLVIGNHWDIFTGTEVKDPVTQYSQTANNSTDLTETNQSHQNKYAWAPIRSLKLGTMKRREDQVANNTG